MSLQAKVKRELDTGTHVDRRDGKVLFRDFAEEWRSNQGDRTGTVAQVETNLRVNTYPSLGHLSLNAIKRSDVQRLVTSLGQRLAPQGPSTSWTASRLSSSLSGQRWA